MSKAIMRPLPLLFGLFLTVPLVEIALLIKVGAIIGPGWTIFLVVLTALIGAALVRVQGLATFARMQAMLARGEMPAVEMFEAMALFLAGALLLTPGFFTDIFGFIVLVPAIRRMFIHYVLQRGSFWVAGSASGRPSSGQTPLEGHWKREDDR